MTGEQWVSLIDTAGISFTSKGVMVKGHVTFGDWLSAGERFRDFVTAIDASVAMAWGDWLLIGEEHFPGEYSQGLDLVQPVSHDPAMNPKAESTLNNYRWVAKNTPHWMRGLPGLGFRHYADALRIKAEEERYAFLMNASQNGWSVRRAAQELPPRENDTTPLPGTTADAKFELEVENHVLRQELAERQAALEETDGNIEKARDILEDVAYDLPEAQAEQVRKALDYLKPVVVKSEFISLVGQAVDLYREGRYSEMVFIMDQLGEMYSELFSARAEVVLNGKIIDAETGEVLEDA